MSNKKSFHKLLEPYHVGHIQTRNRMVKTAAGTNLWDSGEHRVSTKAKAFYETVARGGIGLLIVESPIMEFPYDEPMDLRYRIDDDKYIPDVSELANVIHKYNCPTFVQLYHRGPWPQPYAPRRPLIAASPVNPPVVRSEFDHHGENVPRELNISEIEELIEIFVSATIRLHKAGFDGIELNSGSDSLFATFLSRFWNKRKDIYGCDTLENRTRFLREIIKGVKTKLGNDFPIVVLINGVEVGGGDEGITVTESQEIAKILEKAGADALHVRSHWFGNHVGSYNHDNLFYPEPQIPLKYFPKELDWSIKGAGVNTPVAGLIKKVVSIPVITVGGFYPELAEKVLNEGKADFIGFCRSIFADPELPNKILSHRIDDIAPCTHCSTCQKMNLLPKECRINAALGTENYTIEKAKVKKNVMIIGSGPAGMEAARVAALRGHRVTLYEKMNKFGGSLLIATMIKGTEIEDIPAMIRYLKNQIHKLGVNTILGVNVTSTLIKKIKPDVLIIATGGIPTVPQIPGINHRKVINNALLYNTLKRYLRFFEPNILRFLTRLWMPVGKRVVIIGSTIAACQLAEFLVKRNRIVTIADTVDIPGEGLVPERKNRLFWWFRKKGVRIFTGIKFREITNQGLTISTKEGNLITLEADNIIPVLPLSANMDLIKSLEGEIPEVYAIGDCKEPRLIPEAIADGWRLGNKI